LQSALLACSARLAVLGYSTLQESGQIAVEETDTRLDLAEVALPDQLASTSSAGVMLTWVHARPSLLDMVIAGECR
jgi:hypothetical protein